MKNQFGFEFGTEKNVNFLKNSHSLISNRPFYFSLALPEGNYRVTIGYIRLSDRAYISTVRSESRGLHLEQINVEKNSFVEKKFIVHTKDALIRKGEYVRLKKPRELKKLDWDNKLTLEFQHTSHIAYIRVESVSGIPTIF
ncbi:hypothetical protein [Sphingobacterium sp. JB170]|uniref:hypothetical protein n=1 Tax=Sphingobacterium sp. JB170 TaxID=1434842 RepID=UPI00117B6079|nr:hypothetical protein [Sphingobacterium sp. JB170]